MKLLTTLILVFLTGQCLCQSLTIPLEYNFNISKADSLVSLKKYREAAAFYSQAFKAFDWRALPDDRYKAATAFALSNQPDSAIFNIQKLCTQRYVNHLRLSENNAFDDLKRTYATEWHAAIECIKANKNKYSPALNLEWANTLKQAYDEDQGIRLKQIEYEKNAGYDSAMDRSFTAQMIKSDSANLMIVSDFLDKHGWRGADEVGVEGNIALFAVLQHSDLLHQEKYLPMLRNAVKEQKALPQSLALMEDRVSMAKFGYQVYGSQVSIDPVTHKFVLAPINDETNVDKRRSEVGLGPLRDYLKRFGIDYAPK